MTISEIIERLMQVDKGIIEAIADHIGPDPDPTREGLWRASQRTREVMFILVDIGRSEPPVKKPVKSL